MTDDQLDLLGTCADNVDNLLGAMQLPMGPERHLSLLKPNLESLSRRLKDLVIEIGGENPWEDVYESPSINTSIGEGFPLDPEKTHTP